MLSYQVGQSFHNDYGALLINGKAFRYFRNKNGSKMARMYFRGVNLLFPCLEKYRVTLDCIIIRFPFTELFEFATLGQNKVDRPIQKKKSLGGSYSNLDQVGSTTLVTLASKEVGFF